MVAAIRSLLFGAKIALRWQSRASNVSLLERQKLAEFENMGEQVQITAEVLRRDGFGKTKYFHCVVAHESLEGADDKTNALLGYAIYFFAYSTWEGKMLYVEDLFVDKEYRRNGLATSMWKAITEVAVEEDCSRIQWTALSHNVRAIEFFEAMGAVDLTRAEQWHVYRLNRDKSEAYCRNH